MRLPIALALLSAAGCVTDVEGLEDDAELSTEASEILNGDAVPADNSGLPMLTNGCSSTLLDNYWVLTAAHCVDSYYDHGFDSDGHTMVRFVGQEWQGAKAIASDAYGRAVVAGTVSLDGVSQFGVARIRSNGSPDPYFGSSGRVVTSFAGTVDSAGRAVAIDSQQRIVVGGWAENSYGLRMFALARYTPSGALDNTFGYYGRVVTNIGASSDEEISGLAIDAQDRIVVGGTGQVNGRAQFVVARYATNGYLDTSWSGDGIAITDFVSTHEGIKGLALDHAGRAVAVGWGDDSLAVARYTTNGYLDTTFDGNGMRLVRYNEQQTVANAVAIDASNRIVVTGSSTGSKGMLVGRLTTGGAMDTTFDGNGWTALTPKLNWVEADGKAIAIDKSGRIVVAGTAANSSIQNVFAVGRLTSNGAQDGAFNGHAGMFGDYAFDPLDGMSYEAFANGIALDPSGNILLSFELDGLSSSTGTFGVVKVLPEFQNVPAWSGLGVRMGDQSVNASRVFRYGALDVALIKLASPLAMNGSYSGYQFAGFYTGQPTNLVGHTLDCYGYGRSTVDGGGGTLRTADLKVGSVNANNELVLDMNDRDQQIWKGDSGGPCFIYTTAGWRQAGVTSWGNTQIGAQVAASSFYGWVATTRMQY